MIPQETKPAPRWYPPLIVILVFAALAFAGTKDFQDAEREHEHYINMVCAGHWPDFKNLQGECDEH